MYMGVEVPASIIIPIIPAALKYRYLPEPQKIVSWYLFVAAIFSLINNLLGFSNINNMPVMHVYTFVEFVLLVLFYRNVLTGTRIGKYAVYAVPFFLIFCVVNVLFFQDIYTYNTHTKSIEALLVIFMAIAYFRKTLDRIGKDDARYSPLSYINSGLLLYFSGSFIWFTIFNLTVQNKSFGMVMWSIHATFLLVLYILIATALWKYKE